MSSGGAAYQAITETSVLRFSTVTPAPSVFTYSGCLAPLRSIPPQAVSVADPISPGKNMTAKQLIAELSKLNPDVDVVCYSEDRELLTEGMEFRLLEIESVDTTVGEKVNLDGTPTIRMGDPPSATIVGRLHVTLDFEAQASL
jgi:hypothetical protein